jgi:lipopolysaccharide export LptBFGC system permease protein LptF
MMIATRASIALYCIVGLFLIVGGANYILRSEYMPYHARATGIEWESLTPEHQGTYLGLMKGRGAGGVAVGTALILLSVFALREHDTPVRWILPGVAVLFLAIATYSTWYMRANTRGGPPIFVGVVMIVLVLGAAALSLAGRSRS